MIDIEKIEAMLIKHEGLKLKPYKCSAGKTTIGVGRNLDDVGISRVEALLLLEHDIKEVIADLYDIFKNFHDLSENIKLALIDMRFNLGYKGFRNFRKMIDAVRKEDFKRMAEEMKDSRWFDQVGARSQNLYNMIIKEVA